MSLFFSRDKTVIKPSKVTKKSSKRKASGDNNGSNNNDDDNDNNNNANDAMQKTPSKSKNGIFENKKIENFLYFLFCLSEKQVDVAGDTAKYGDIEVFQERKKTMQNIKS